MSTGGGGVGAGRMGQGGAEGAWGRVGSRGVAWGKMGPARQMELSQLWPKERLDLPR